MTAKRVPVRIQMWVDGVMVETRCWLDDFTLTNDIESARYGENGMVKYGSGPYHQDITLRAHANSAEGPWKFQPTARGKPRRPQE